MSGQDNTAAAGLSDLWPGRVCALCVVCVHCVQCVCRVCAVCVLCVCRVCAVCLSCVCVQALGECASVACMGLSIEPETWALVLNQRHGP